MALPEKKGTARFTYGAYLTWPEEERWELIEGVPYDMTPVPSRRHQEILVAMTGRFQSYLEGKSCHLYIAPFDVRLPTRDERDEDVETVVQPDLFIVCDPSKLDDRGCRGAPDLVAEILSPSTAPKDHITKLALYEKHGVREYWLVHPTDKIVMVYRLGATSTYGAPTIYSSEQQVEVGIFEDLTLDLNAIFRE